jgi:hypothetical protein
MRQLLEKVGHFWTGGARADRQWQGNGVCLLQRADQDLGGGVALELAGGAGDGAPPTRIPVLQSRHETTWPRSWSSTSMYLRHFGLGH